MFTIYSKPGCAYCERAKDLISSKNLPYVEQILDVGQEKQVGKNYYTVDQLKKLVPSARTVPQIFLNEELIGGFDALKLHFMKQG